MSKRCIELLTTAAVSMGVSLTISLLYLAYVFYR